MTHSRVPIDVYKFLIAYYGGERHAPFVDFLAEHYEGRGLRRRLGARAPRRPRAAPRRRHRHRSRRPTIMLGEPDFAHVICERLLTRSDERFT